MKKCSGKSKVRSGNVIRWQTMVLMLLL
jgi:hypothetical protein